MDMNIFQAVILGLVQGVTEFIPISSSGHLVLLQKIFGVDEGSMLFTIMLHLGTLLSVFFVFWRDIVEIIKRPFSKMPLWILSATIPTVLIALVFKSHIESAFSSASTLGIGFLATGCILWSVESMAPGKKVLGTMTWKDSLVVGMAQGIALMPAISRSGSTIAGGLFCGLDRNFAAKFSFLMSIPAILGSIVFQIADVSKSGQSFELMPILIGTVVAALSGFLAIRFMLSVISKKSLKIFSYYLFVIGFFVLTDQLIFRMVF
jgi:undecaprenyl-diphosphatase